MDSADIIAKSRRLVELDDKMTALQHLIGDVNNEINALTHELMPIIHDVCTPDMNWEKYEPYHRTCEDCQSKVIYYARINLDKLEQLIDEKKLRDEKVVQQLQLQKTNPRLKSTVGTLAETDVID